MEYKQPGKLSQGLQAWALKQLKQSQLIFKAYQALSLV